MGFLCWRRKKPQREAKLSFSSSDHWTSINSFLPPKDRAATGVSSHSLQRDYKNFNQHLLSPEEMKKLKEHQENYKILEKIPCGYVGLRKNDYKYRDCLTFTIIGGGLLLSSTLIGAGIAMQIPLWIMLAGECTAIGGMFGLLLTCPVMDYVPYKTRSSEVTQKLKAEKEAIINLLSKKFDSGIPKELIPSEQFCISSPKRKTI